MSPMRTDPDQGLGFRHEATFYDGRPSFVSATAPFIRQGLAAEERILVVLTPDKIEALQAELGTQATGVTFADMAEIGRNPARIIPAWQDFLLDADGADVRGVGEPIWAERSPDALIECERHEALLNVAFEGGRPWQLLCPYDERTLGAGTLREARRNHPLVRRDEATTPSSTYPGVEAFVSTTGEPLSPAPRDAATIPFAGRALGDVRMFAESFAAAHGFRRRSDDVRLVAQELSSNGVRHGGGKGTLQDLDPGCIAHRPGAEQRTDRGSARGTPPACRRHRRLRPVDRQPAGRPGADPQRRARLDRARPLRLRSARLPRIDRHLTGVCELHG